MIFRVLQQFDTSHHSRFNDASTDRQSSPSHSVWDSQSLPAFLEPWGEPLPPPIAKSSSASSVRTGLSNVAWVAAAVGWGLFEAIAPAINFEGIL